jgi:hypothetical protein
MTEPVHMNTPGAFLAARSAVAGLKGLTDHPIDAYLSYLGQQVTPASATQPSEWTKPVSH